MNIIIIIIIINSSLSKYLKQKQSPPLPGKIQNSAVWEKAAFEEDSENIESKFFID